ncbi:MAG: hypothetical protein O7E54_03795 [Planctomycetota bacterium]|nr:hypothetical protein [Planctomycetota bacterium]
MRATALFLVLAPLAYAQSNDKYVDQLVAVIKQGHLSHVVSRLNVDVLSSNADYAARVCAAAAGAKLSDARAYPDEYRAAAQKILEIGTKAKDASLGETKGMLAYVDALYFKLRLARALLEETSTEDWLKIVEMLEDVHDLEADGGKPLERAVKILREGQKAKGVDVDNLKTREKALSKEAAETYPKIAIFQSSGFDDEIKEIERLIETDRKEGKKRLGAFLDKLKAKLEKDKKSIDLNTAYNDAVTIAKINKGLGVKADYTSYTYTKGKLLRFAKIMGRRWKVEKSGAKDLGAIVQYGRDGRFMRRITLDYYKRNVWYLYGDTKYDGSNVKMMAMIGAVDVKTVVLTVKRERKLTKGRLNRHIKQSYIFEIGGLDKLGKFTRFRCYYFKGRETKHLTFEVMVVEFDDFKKLDPEAAFVIASLREVK